MEQIKVTKWKSCFLRTLWISILCFSMVLSPTFGTQAANEKKVALVMKALTNPFFSTMESGAKKYAQQENIPLEVFGTERETDVERQIGIVENLISRGFGAIVIAPVDSKKLVPICAKALEKNIVVVNIDNPLHKETMAQQNLSIPFIGSDSHAGAKLVGAYIKKKLKGRGRVIIIEGIRGVENADQRKAGFIEAVTKDSAISVVATGSANWHTDEALSLTVDLLRLHGLVDAILCANDKMAIGVLQALDLMDLTDKVLIGAYDNIEEVRNEMRNGRIQATVEQHPELMGQYGVQLAWQALNGNKIPKYTSTPLDLVTHETFGKKIALFISHLKNPFFKTLYQSAQEAADLFGMDLIVSDAQNGDARQLSAMLNTVQAGASVLVINPANSHTIAPGIELANEKKIPVITVDRKSAGGEIVCHIESDNIRGGRMAGKSLVRYLGGKGRIIEIEGIPGTSAAQERGLGFNQVIWEHSQMKVVARETAHFDRKRAQETMLRLLQTGVNFDAVFAHNDNMILGALEAMESVGYTLPRVLIGFDAIREAVRAVEQGKLTATIAQRPERMGRLAIQSAARILRGEQLPSEIPVELELIEK
ncbi:MAG: substrate-binding domain-containing protein [Desulfobacterales bacterium]|jgi:ABC-type sugar transport system substrate-binding protein